MSYALNVMIYTFLINRNLFFLLKGITLLFNDSQYIETYVKLVNS